MFTPGAKITPVSHSGLQVPEGVKIDTATTGESSPQASVSSPPGTSTTKGKADAGGFRARRIMRSGIMGSPIPEPPRDDEEDALDTEGFLDILKSIVKVALPIGKTILSTAPIATLGPVGTVLSPLAGITLKAASKLTEPGFDGDNAAEMLTKDDGIQAAMHRAILAEAALAAVVSLDVQAMQESGILDDMRTIVGKNIHTIKAVAPGIRNAVLEPGFRISLDMLREREEKLQRGPEPRRSIRRALPGAETLDTEPSDLEGYDFLRGLAQGQTKVVQGAEDFFDDILSVIKRGVAIRPQSGSENADAGLKVLTGVLGTESSFDDPNDTGATKVFDKLAQRSVVAEAALLAIMKKDTRFLSEARDHDEDGDPESIFDIIKRTIQIVAPKVIKALPTVIKVATPIVQGLIGGPH